MGRLATFFPRVWSRLRGRTIEEFFRNVAFTLYILYIYLAVICIILPFQLEVERTPFFILAGSSGFYTLLLYNFRYKLYLYYYLMFNCGLLVILISCILFVIGLTIVAAILVTVGLLAVVMCVTYDILRKMKVDIVGELDQLEQKANVIANPVAHGYAIQLVPHLRNGHVEQTEQGQ